MEKVERGRTGRWSWASVVDSDVLGLDEAGPARFFVTQEPRELGGRLRRDHHRAIAQLFQHGGFLQNCQNLLGQVVLDGRRRICGTDRLLRLSLSHCTEAPGSVPLVPKRRSGSPEHGCSILIT